MLQLPARLGSFEVVTPRILGSVTLLDLKIEVWTINEPEEMKKLVALNVDGIMTDYPDRLLKLLGR